MKRQKFHLHCDLLYASMHKPNLKVDTEKETKKKRKPCHEKRITEVISVELSDIVCVSNVAYTRDTFLVMSELFFTVFAFKPVDQFDSVGNFRINFEGMRCIRIFFYFVIYSVVSVSKADELSNEILIRFEKLLPKKYDFQVLQTMNILNLTLQRFNEFQRENIGEIESRDAINNARIGIFVFTRYCGPGARLLNRILNRDERTYASIDNCCRAHDECPDFVSQLDDYKNYPELDYRPQFFSRFVEISI